MSQRNRSTPFAARYRQRYLERTPSTTAAAAANDDKDKETDDNYDVGT